MIIIERLFVHNSFVYKYKEEYLKKKLYIFTRLAYNRNNILILYNSFAYWMTLYEALEIYINL